VNTRAGERIRTPRADATRMRHAFACAFVLALALIAAVGAVPAQAELQLGIQDDALLTSQEPNAWPFARGLAPKVVRYNVAWEQVAPQRPVAADDPADPAYDFKRADAMDKQTAAIGAQSLFTIVNSPRWANGGKAPRYAPLSADAYGQFCGAVAWRYSGTYTPPGSLVPLPAVKNFTVWNEPNRGQYLLPQGPNGQTAARTFAGLVRACADAVHAVSPDARVAAGPIASRGAQGGAAPLAFLDAYRLAGGPRPDALAFNPYMNGLAPEFKPDEKPADGAITLRNLDQLEHWLSKAYGGSVPIWFTEFAWRTAPTPKLGTISPAKQADLLRKTVTLVRTHYPYAKLLVWYLVRDESPTSYWRSGLATFDWQEKPAYGLYKVLAGL
jgi:hypothetical protein